MYAYCVPSSILMGDLYLWPQWGLDTVTNHRHLPQPSRPYEIWWVHYLPDLIYLLLSSCSAALFSPVFLLPQEYAKIISTTSRPLHLLFPLPGKLLPFPTPCVMAFFLSFPSQFKCHFLRQISPGPTLSKLTSPSCP